MVILPHDVQISLITLKGSMNYTPPLPRDVIDWSVNNYGDPFFEFLTSVNCCIVNGRNSTHNDFTWRNVSVVDYCIIPYERLNNIQEFRVQRSTEHFQAALEG